MRVCTHAHCAGVHLRLSETVRASPGRPLQQFVGSARELAVAVGDPAGGVRGPTERYPLVRDGHVRVMVLLLRKLGDPIHERDGVGKRGQLELALQGTVHLEPVRRGAHERQYGEYLEPAPTLDRNATYIFPNRSEA